MKNLTIPQIKSFEILSTKEMKSLKGGESETTTSICVGATDFNDKSTWECFSSGREAETYSQSNGVSTNNWWACNTKEVIDHCTKKAS